MTRKERMEEAKGMSLAERKAALATTEKRLKEIEVEAENNHQSTAPWELQPSPLALEHWGLVQRKLAIEAANKRHQ